MQHRAEWAACKPLMHLELDLSCIHMGGSRRDPAARAGRGFPDVEPYKDITRLAERGVLDMIFPPTAQACRTPIAAQAKPPWNWASTSHARTSTRCWSPCPA